jgi:heme exporter protein D
MSEFFAMRGYGLYVWGAYGVTFALIAVEVFMLARRAKSLRRNINVVSNAN